MINDRRVEVIRERLHVARERNIFVSFSYPEVEGVLTALDDAQDEVAREKKWGRGQADLLTECATACDAYREALEWIKEFTTDCDELSAGWLIFERARELLAGAKAS